MTLDTDSWLVLDVFILIANIWRRSPFLLIRKFLVPGRLGRGQGRLFFHVRHRHRFCRTYQRKIAYQRNF